MGYRNGISKRGEKGQALIEMALVMLLLSVIVFGIAELGQYYFYQNTFNSAARAGVRQAAVTPNLVADDTRITGPAGYVKSLLASSLSSATISNTTVKVLLYNDPTTPPCTSSPNPCTCSGTGGSGSGGAVNIGDRVEVRVCWNFQILTGSIIPFFSGSRWIAGDAAMRYEL
jgi:Flp pilus assembly protein TadG